MKKLISLMLAVLMLLGCVSLAFAEDPIELEFWHSWGSGANYEAIQKLVGDFNAANEGKIHVNEQYVGNYAEVLSKFNVSFSTGDNTLNQPVVAGGIAGGDAGRYILRRLDEEGIAHRFTQTAGESRSCINILDQATGLQTEYLEPGSPVSEEEYDAFLRDFDALAAQCPVITMSGSLPKGMDSHVYARLIERARKAGGKVLLDASGAALTDALDSHPYYIKPNEDEIRMLSGCDAANEDAVVRAALNLHRRGIANVVVSMGSRGALMVCGQGMWRGVPPRIQAVNTVGCGDSMTAAFAAAALQGLSPEEALRYAVAVSAAGAMSEATGGLEMNTFRALLPQVQVYSL